jgi:riboflavin kinase / FMN adenylyltransferase
LRVVRGLETSVPASSGTAVAIGTFDGVHLGHRALIHRTRTVAEKRGLASGVVTWDRHPLSTVRPDDVPPLLTSLERKLELLEGTGVELTLVVPFNEDFSEWSPERFVDEVLVARMRAHHVAVGRNWRFGHRAAGDTELLSKLGTDRDFAVDAVGLEHAEDEIVSSTRIRKAIAEGEMEKASVLLGREFDVDGVVVRGDGRGATLGYPTANLDIARSLARPAQGVYAGRIGVDGQTYRAAINVGKNLTFGGEVVRVEVYILDFDTDIYGLTVRLGFSHRLRDELKFDSVDALIGQMAADVAKTRDLIRLS